MKWSFYIDGFELALFVLVLSFAQAVFGAGMCPDDVTELTCQDSDLGIGHRDFDSDGDVEYWRAIAGGEIEFTAYKTCHYQKDGKRHKCYQATETSFNEKLSEEARRSITTVLRRKEIAERRQALQYEISDRAYQDGLDGDGIDYSSLSPLLSQVQNLSQLANFQNPNWGGSPMGLGPNMGLSFPQTAWGPNPNWQSSFQSGIAPQINQLQTDLNTRIQMMIQQALGGSPTGNTSDLMNLPALGVP